jgi:three-Cys-motif partner protein
MAAPTEVLWDGDEHTFAKHALLRSYLAAWLPIMSRFNNRLILIDGFAGPGRYLGGEIGSPLIMLDAYLAHAHRALPHLAAVSLVYVFIEEDHERSEHLRGELAAYTLPPNVQVLLVEGSFDTEMQRLLGDMPPGFRLAPTFAFIDPFGYTDHGLHLSSRILGFPRCEVLVYVPFPFIARFVDQIAIEATITRLYGNDSWKVARGKRPLRERIELLHDAFLAALLRSAKFARSFEMISKGGRTGYHLFFGTRHPLGLERMKEAMWKVDPIAGSTFADSTSRGQLTLFTTAPELSVLADALRARFHSDDFTVEEAETFTLVHTPFAPSLHLRETLRAIEGTGGLDARHPDKPRRRNTFPAGTVIRLLAPGSAPA